MVLAIVVGVLVAIAVAALLQGIGRSIEPEEELDQRIEEWVVTRARSKEGTGLEVDDGAEGMLGQVDRSLSQQSFAARMRTDLARADLKITVAEYLLIRIVMVVVAFAIGYLIARNLLSGLLIAAVGFVLPILYVRMRQRARLRAFDDQLPDVLDHMVGSLRAGYGLMQAVEWVGRQVADPSGDEFRRVLREVQLGRSLMDSFDSMVRRIDSDDLALVVTAIKIQHEVGGSLAEILEIVAHTIRERVRILREIQVLTSQQRYSGYVLMVMPIALGLVLFLMSPEYMMQLFKPGPTLCIPIGAVIMMVIGFFVMRRIVDIEV